MLGYLVTFIAVGAAVASNIQWHWIENNLAAGVVGGILAWFALRLYERINNGYVEPWNSSLRQCHEERNLERLNRDLRKQSQREDGTR